MVYLPVPEPGYHERTVHYVDHCTFVRTDRHCDRHCCRHWHAGSGKTISDLHDGRHQYPDAERRHCNRYLHDAVVYRPSDSTLGFTTILLAHITFQHSLRDLERTAQTETDQQTHLRSRTGSGRFSDLCLFQGGIPGYPAGRILRIPSGIYHVTG